MTKAVNASVLIFNQQSSIFSLQLCGRSSRLSRPWFCRFGQISTLSFCEEGVWPGLYASLLFADDDVLEHLVIPHQRTELLLEGVPCRPVRLEKVDCDLADDVEVLRGIRVAHPGVVLAGRRADAKTGNREASASGRENGSARNARDVDLRAASAGIRLTQCRGSALPPGDVCCGELCRGERAGVGCRFRAQVEGRTEGTQGDARLAAVCGEAPARSIHRGD